MLINLVIVCLLQSVAAIFHHHHKMMPTHNRVGTKLIIFNCSKFITFCYAINDYEVIIERTNKENFNVEQSIEM